MFDVCFSVNNLAMMLQKQGKLAEAELLLVEVLAGYKSQLGDKDTHTLASVAMSVAMSQKSIGALYASQGKFNEALEMHRKSLDIKSKLHGPDHPEVVEMTQAIRGLEISKQISTAQSARNTRCCAAM